MPWLSPWFWVYKIVEVFVKGLKNAPENLRGRNGLKQVVVSAVSLEGFFVVFGGFLSLVGTVGGNSASAVKLAGGLLLGSSGLVVVLCLSVIACLGLLKNGPRSEDSRKSFHTGQIIAGSLGTLLTAILVMGEAGLIWAFAVALVGGAACVRAFNEGPADPPENGLMPLAGEQAPVSELMIDPSQADRVEQLTAHFTREIAQEGEKSRPRPTRIETVADKLNPGRARRKAMAQAERDVTAARQKALEVVAQEQQRQQAAQRTATAFPPVPAPLPTAPMPTDVAQPSPLPDQPTQQPELEVEEPEELEPEEPKRSVEEIFAEFAASKPGLEGVMGKLREITDLAEDVAETRELGSGDKKLPLFNMVLAGKPGVGKTSVATEFLAPLLYAAGIVESPHVTEIVASQLKGHDTADRLNRILDENPNVVVVIDEAHSLLKGDIMQQGQEVVNILTQRANRERRRPIVLVGYPNEMEELLASDVGLKRRFPHKITFSDYTALELTDIFLKFVRDIGSTLDGDAENRAVEVIEKIHKREGSKPHFGNAGEMENLLGFARGARNERLKSLDLDADEMREMRRRFVAEDIENAYQRYLESKKVRAAKEQEPLAQVMNDLDRLIGLDSIKEELKSWAARAEDDARRIKAGENVSPPSLGFRIVGPPGTGKSEIAAIVPRILHSKELSFLETGEPVRVTRGDLTGKWQGDTESKTRAKLAEADGGALIVEEAHNLIKDDHDTYGRIIVGELIDPMERARGRTSFIFVGYEDAMEHLMDFDDGMRRRLPNVLRFQSYSANELAQIFELMVEAAGFELTEDARKRGAEVIAEIHRNNASNPRFGNAGEMRNLCEKAISVRALRLQGSEVHDPTITAEDIEEAYRRYGSVQKSQNDPGDGQSSLLVS